MPRICFNRWVACQWKLQLRSLLKALGWILEPWAQQGTLLACLGLSALHTSSAKGLQVHASRDIGRKFLSPELVELE